MNSPACSETLRKSSRSTTCIRQTRFCLKISLPLLYKHSVVLAKQCDDGKQSALLRNIVCLNMSHTHYNKSHGGGVYRCWAVLECKKTQQGPGRSRERRMEEDTSGQWHSFSISCAAFARIRFGQCQTTCVYSNLHPFLPKLHPNKNTSFHVVKIPAKSL